CPLQLLRAWLITLIPYKLKIPFLLMAAAMYFAPSLAVAFGLQDVEVKARALVARPYQAPPGIPKALGKLDYDHYRAIHFRPEKALWPGSNFRVQFFSPGGFYTHPVKINVVKDGRVDQIAYRKSMFDYGGDQLEGKIPPHLGFAGFRLHYTPAAPPGKA